jgi:uncharacterized YccA/Bax inhibitor family protein
VATTSNRKKRRTKHRGNAVGMVEARGRTGRKPEPQDPKAARRAARANRFDQPPTWSGAATRAGIAALLFVVLVILAFGQPVGSSIALGVFVFLLYIPLGFYTDQLFYKRRQRKLAGR